MMIPYDVWLKTKYSKEIDLDTALRWWNISKSNSASALWVEI